MTPERLEEIRTHDKADNGLPAIGRNRAERAMRDREELLEYIDLLHEDLRLTRAERDAEKHKNLALRKGQGTYHQENK